MPSGGSQHAVNGMTHYERNRKQYLDRVKVRREALRAYIQWVKENSRCADCHISDYRVLDFDHLPGNEKYDGISEMVSRGVSLVRLAEEMGKCDVVCSNCHRIRTWNRLNMPQ